MKPVIITVSRQFGSHGREIGRLCAEILDIGYYDKEIMEAAARSIGLSPAFFEDANQNADGLYSFGHNFGLGALTSLSLNVQASEKAGDFIREIARREDAVIVGRCADWFLKDNDQAIHVYICADQKDRIQRTMEETGLGEKKAQKKVHDMDDRREAFYEFVTGKKFGDPSRFDAVINTSETGIEGAVRILCGLYDQAKGFQSLKGGYVDQYIEHKKSVG